MLNFFFFLMFVTVPVLSEEFSVDSNMVDASDSLVEVFTSGSVIDALDTLVGMETDTTSVLFDSTIIDFSDSSVSLSDSLQMSLQEKVAVPSILYPGVTPEQDELASEVVNRIYSFSWSEADRVVRKMQRLERKEDLPPLSYLLQVSGKVIRIQNGEFENEREKRKILEDIKQLSKVGLMLSDPSSVSDSLLPTFLLIHSGIKGFAATLKISRNLVEAAIEGLSALRLLEKLMVSNPEIKDTYLGLGIFYCALAKAPAIVRGALNITGRAVSFEKGIDYLRVSASQGKYTNETARQYLIQFLSPYWGHLREEKKEIFEYLQKTYPQNPYYLFLQTDEYICFHRDMVNEEYKQELREKISSFKSSHYSVKRYINLLKWQYCFLDSGSTVQPDAGFNLKEFDYYPVFLEFLSGDGDKREGSRGLRGGSVLKMIDASGMSLNRKNFFSWHVRDALKTF